MFAAMLKLPSSMPMSEKVGRALDIAEILNIKKSLDNVVGSSLVKGISGESPPAFAQTLHIKRTPSV